MKLLKIFGIVAGIHAAALLLIFVNPGCSSSTAQPAPAAAPVKSDPTPSISVANTVAPADASPAPIIAAPLAPDASSAQAGTLFKPTRPGTLAASALESQPVSGVTPATTYTVVKGDSLWSVAKKNHIKVSELAAANGLHSGATLQLGQKLILPAKSPIVAPAAAASEEAPFMATPPKTRSEGSKHVVRPGETLGSIARKYGVRMGDLATANAISDPKTIHPGQELVIPAGGRAPAKASGSAAKAAAPAAAPAGAAPVPAPGQDLDSGLKGSQGSEIPVIKIEPEQPAAPSGQSIPSKAF